MSYTYSFFDNQTIGVDELNKITARFVTNGVARTPTRLSDINAYVSDIATKGVVGNTSNELAVSVSGGEAVIAPGTAFFDNGTVIEITASERLELTPNAVNYVFLKSDMGENKIYPVASTVYPESNENIVHLATINANNTVVDTRTYARGKCGYYSSFKNMFETRITFTSAMINSKTPIRVDTGSESFSFINLRGENGVYKISTCNINGKIENGEITSVFGVVKFDSAGEKVSAFNCADNPTYVMGSISHRLKLNLSITFEGSVMVITPKQGSASETDGATFDITMF